MWRLLVTALAGCGFHGAALPDSLGGGDAQPDGAGSIDAPAIDASVGTDAPLTPISLVQKHADKTTGPLPASTLNVFFDTALTQHDLAIVVVAFFQDVPITHVIGVTDTPGDTFLQIGAPLSRSNFTQVMFAAADLRGAGTKITVSLDAETSLIEARVYEYRGLAPTNPLDKSVGAIGTSLTLDSTQVTTKHAHDLLFGAGTIATMSAVNAPGPGFTMQAMFNGDGDEDQIVTTANAYSATMHQTATTDYVMMLAAFKAAD